MADLENRLWATAVQTARQAGMEFTVPCSHNLRDLIRAGIGAMRRSNRVTEPDCEAADTSLQRLVGEMIRATAELGDNAKSGTQVAIREGALVQAKKLGRLWPYG